MTADEITLDELDTRLAQTAAALLKSILQAARCRAADSEADFISNLQACRLTITAAGPQITIEVTAPFKGITMLLYGGTFEEPGALLQ